MNISSAKSDAQWYEISKNDVSDRLKDLKSRRFYTSLNLKAAKGQRSQVA